jgi:hypothetical protein
MHIVPSRHSKAANPIAIPCSTTSITNLYGNDLRLQKGECNNLRVGLQLDKEGIAEYREGSDEYHEHGTRP